MKSARPFFGANLAGYPVALLWPLNLLRHRSARFALVGVAATLAHGATLGLLSGSGRLSPLASNTIALFVAAVLSYLGHRSFTFRATANHTKSMGKFLMQLSGSWIVTSGIAIVLIPIVGAWPVSALIVVLVPCLNYVVYARWTFR